MGSAWTQNTHTHTYTTTHTHTHMHYLYIHKQLKHTRVHQHTNNRGKALAGLRGSAVARCCVKLSQVSGSACVDMSA